MGMNDVERTGIVEQLIELLNRAEQLSVDSPMTERRAYQHARREAFRTLAEQVLLSGDDVREAERVIGASETEAARLNRLIVHQERLARCGRLTWSAKQDGGYDVYEDDRHRGVMMDDTEPDHVSACRLDGSWIGRFRDWEEAMVGLAEDAQLRSSSELAA